MPDAESPALDLGRIPHAGVVNADGTLLEPPDLWKRDLDPALRDRFCRAAPTTSPDLENACP